MKKETHKQKENKFNKRHDSVKIQISLISRGGAAMPFNV